MKCPRCGCQTPTKKNLTFGEDAKQKCSECGKLLDKQEGKNNLIQK